MKCRASAVVPLLNLFGLLSLKQLAHSFPRDTERRRAYRQPAQQFVGSREQAVHVGIPGIAECHTPSRSQSLCTVQNYADKITSCKLARPFL